MSFRLIAERLLPRIRPHYEGRTPRHICRAATFRLLHGTGPGADRLQDVRIASRGAGSCESSRDGRNLALVRTYTG